MQVSHATADGDDHVLRRLRDVDPVAVPAVEHQPRVVAVREGADQQVLWEAASLPVSSFPEGYDAGLVLSRRHGDRVHVAQSPQDVIVTVCGGMGNLHALSMPSWGDTKSVTAAVR